MKLRSALALSVTLSALLSVPRAARAQDGTAPAAAAVATPADPVKYGIALRLPR